MIDFSITTTHYHNLGRGYRGGFPIFGRESFLSFIENVWKPFIKQKLVPQIKNSIGEV
jgi:hypothetical protein